MPIQIIDKGFGNIFFDVLDSTKNRISVVSPFISFETASRLSNWLEEQNRSVDCTVITRFNREEFIQGANSIRGLLRLHQAGARILALQHLHTKLYLFDKTTTIMGSANFTMSGFFKNHELGLFIKNEPTFAIQCMNYFEDLVSSIQKTGNWELTLDQLQKEALFVEGAVNDRKRKPGIIEYNQYRWGAVLDTQENDKAMKDLYNTKTNRVGEDFLEKILKETSLNVDLDITGFRIKFEGTSEDRISSDLVYLEQKRTLHEHINRTYYPRPPRSIQPGETIFLAVVSEKNGRGTPIIVGYATTTEGFREENVITNSDYNFKKWNMKYPYYIEYQDAKFISDPIHNGISIVELCEVLRHEVYPRTYNDPDTPFSSILKRHHEKAHIQITQKAGAYLKNRLDQHFSKNGYDEVK